MNFEPSGFFVLRTPLLPFDDFLAWSDGLQAASNLNDRAQLDCSLSADAQLLGARLADIVSRPEVREAIFVASPHLEESLRIWIREPASERGKGIELAIARYFFRMTGRATPFGLCAGCSVGLIGAQTQLVLAGRADYRRHTRLDMGYLSALCEALAKDAALRRALTYRSNSSLYRAAGRLRYVESRLGENGRSFHLVAVEETEALTRTLERSRAGSSFAALAEALVDEEVSLTDAEAYINELIESQILTSDLAPCLTGSGPVQSLLEQLAKQPGAERVANILEETRAEFAALDATGFGNAPQSYRAVAQGLEKLPAKVELRHLFQVDMIKPTREATLGKAVVDDILRGVNVLHQLTGTSSENAGLKTDLSRFRDAFVARYEGREIPLVEALDADIGIGFPPSEESVDEASPLLKGLAFPAPLEKTTRWGMLERFLLRKLSDALQDGAEEIALRLNELEELFVKNPFPLPDAFSVTATVAADNEAALARGDFRVLVYGIAGPSGARFLGRFCYADEPLRQHVEQHLRAEESLRPHAVFAEIVHLPEGRIGNVLARPILRGYEISYLGRGDADRQIPVTDLYVAVRQKRIVLRSAHLDKEIIPRLSNAHNFSRQSIALYRFLCLLQDQDAIRTLGWTWGALHNAPFLPRVTLGRLILSRACWNLSQKELKAFGKQKDSAGFRAVNAWRERRQIPRMVALADGDNVLPIDFDNLLSVETFVQLAKGREELSLIEIFPAAGQLCVRGPEGRFLHELIIPFVRKRDRQNSDQREENVLPSRHGHSLAAVPRTFPPGSEWLYGKLYTGAATADHVLSEVIGPLAAKLLQSGAVDKWFFIRYRDPHFHLRIRFHGEPKVLHRKVAPAIESSAARLLKEGQLARVQFDTYEREVERYGGEEGILIAEQIFHVDSEAVLQIIERLEASDAGLDERWRLALRGMDALLQDLGLDLAAKFAVVQEARRAFAKEFQVDGPLKGQIGDRFRKERKNLEALLASHPDGEGSPLLPGFEIVRRRSVRLTPIVADLQESEQSGHLACPISELAVDYMHMHANRLLRSAHRAQEVVLYDFLARLYDSQLARRLR